jgi:hypothetical protein
MSKTLKIQNISPRGDLDVPLLGIVLRFGETVTVSQDVADRLLTQPDNYKLAGASEGGTR